MCLESAFYLGTANCSDNIASELDKRKGGVRHWWIYIERGYRQYKSHMNWPGIEKCSLR